MIPIKKTKLIINYDLRKVLLLYKKNMIVIKGSQFLDYKNNPGFF